MRTPHATLFSVGMVAAILISLVASATTTSWAQNGAQNGAPDATASYPSRTITLIVPYPPGGPPDVVARILATPMAQDLGRPIVIENKPGASSSLASVALARAAPDGHTIMVADISQAVAPHILKSPGFDPIKDFKPIGLTTRSMQTLVVSPSLPGTISDLIKMAKDKPDDLKIAHSGIGGPPYLAAVAFMQAADIKLPLVYYRGIAQGVNDVVGGHVAMLFTGASLTAELHKAGKARVVAVTGPRRLAVLPDVPTMEESGIRMRAMRDGYAFGLVAPAGTPDAIIARINASVHKLARDADVVASLARLEISVDTGTPEAFGKIMRDDYDYWRDMLKALGVTATE